MDGNKEVNVIRHDFLGTQNEP